MRTNVDRLGDPSRSLAAEPVADSRTVAAPAAFHLDVSRGAIPALYAASADDLTGFANSP